MKVKVGELTPFPTIALITTPASTTVDSSPTRTQSLANVLGTRKEVVDVYKKDKVISNFDTDPDNQNKDSVCSSITNHTKQAILMCILCARIHSKSSIVQASQLIPISISSIDPIDSIDLSYLYS